MKKWNLIECSGFYAAWPKESQLNAVDSMQRGEMHPDLTQNIPFRVTNGIPIECSGFYPSLPHRSQLNAVDSMQCGAMDTD